MSPASVNNTVKVENHLETQQRPEAEVVQRSTFDRDRARSDRKGPSSSIMHRATALYTTAITTVSAHENEVSVKESQKQTTSVALFRACSL